MRTAHTTIIRPLITEKTMSLAARSWFSFEVTMTATKEDIKSEIKRIYNVTVLAVRTMHVKGKTHRVGKRSQIVERSDRKKAIVQLAPGQRIPVFEVSQEGATQ
jgi:large subunit ribosomal protein L23